MEKSTFTPHSEALRARLVEMRQTAGLTQRQLAERLDRERSFVSRIELGERRLDLVEFFWVSRACGEDPATISAELMREFARLEDRKKRKRSGRRPLREIVREVPRHREDYSRVIPRLRDHSP